MKPYLIQPVGDVSYDYLDKPVRYTPEFLSSLTGNYSCDVCDEHNGAKLTETQNIFFQNDGLYSTFKDDLEVEGKGFSTVLLMKELEDYGEFYLPKTSVLKSVDMVRNPKNLSTLIYNSEDVTVVNQTPVPPVNNESEKMSEEIIRQKEQEIGSLKAQLNSKIDVEKALKSKIQDLNAEIDKKNAEIKDYKESAEENSSKFKKDYDELKNQLDTYKSKEKEEKKELAKELAGEDEELLEEYSNLSTQSLMKIKKANDKYDEQMKKDTNFRGLNSGLVNNQPPKPNDDDPENFNFEEISKKNQIRI